MSKADMPVRVTMCATCPWQPHSKYNYLVPALTESAISEANRICHSTGSNNGINSRTGFPPHICRGAREVQLQFMTATGVIEAPTDEAWSKKRVECGMSPDVIRDPVKK